MNNYQIKLTPVNAYFFGGEKHAEKKGEPGKFEMDYYVRSELYPQQTTLLGTLRYYLLMKNGCLSPRKNNKESQANDLIGKNSFIYRKGETVQTFGKIHSISPLYFLKGDDKYIIAPFDREFELVTEYGNYKMKGYDAKKGYHPVLINLKDKGICRFF